MAVFRCCMLRANRFYRSPNRLRPGCSVVWMAVGFALAGGGMFIGLLIFLSGIVISSPHVVWIKKRSLVSNCLTSMELVSGDALFSPSIFYLLLENDWSGYLLAIVCLIAAKSLPAWWSNSPNIAVLFGKCIVDVCRDIVLGTGTTGRQYISLFIDRFVNRQAFNIEVPTHYSSRWMQLRWCSLGLYWPAGVARKPRQLNIARLAEVCLGLLLMACGFMLLAFDARHAALAVKRQWAWWYPGWR